jgi:manganese/zinc/iron transport system ATP- binding protein
MGADVTASLAAADGAATHERCLLLRDVTIAYGDRVVLSRVNADIPRSQVVSIVGPNGSGKSTLLKAIAGLIPTVSGEITLFDEPIAHMRRRVAYVPQREDVDWSFPVSVRDVVMMGRYPRRGWFQRFGREDAHIVEHAMAHLGIGALAGRQIRELSGGQQRRAFIARAIAQEADVILLDEPMTGIDAETHDRILDLFDEWRAEGKVVLYATHSHIHGGSMIVMRRRDDPIGAEDFAHHAHEGGEHHEHTH